MATLSELFRGKSARFIIPLVLTAAWTMVDLVSIFLGGFVTIDAYWIIGFLAKLAMLLINLWFIKKLFIENRRELYSAFRKYVGYAVVLGYGAINLPILSWQAAGSITAGYALYLWAFGGLQAVLMMAIWLSLRLKQSQVFWGIITPEEAADKKLLQKHLRERKRRPLWVVLENVDMFIQTVFIVIVLQLFLVQLYVIPSESMVPTMLMDDRPLVLKTLDGPTIPLSTIKLPELINVDRGQIVVFESPTYQPPPLAIKVVQEFLFYLTLSLVNLDKNEDGTPKIHFVVKRVTGVPGEKLMMVDDKLYVKTAADRDFHLQEQDALFSHPDFLNQPDNIKARIRDTIVSQERKDFFQKLDARKNALDPVLTQQELAKAVVELKQDFSRVSPNNLLSLDTAFFKGSAQFADQIYANQAAAWQVQNITPWQDINASASDLTTIRHLIAYPAERGALYDFLLSQRLPDPARPENAYQKGARAMNLLHKILIAQRYQILLQLIQKNALPNDYQKHEALLAADSQTQQLAEYMARFYDNRNFPEFPAGKDEYIPQGKYFLMGDNRYNSLDFRFDESQIARTRAVDPTDPQSMVYSSMLAPRLLDRRSIIGHVVTRLWPLDRFGAIKP